MRCCRSGRRASTGRTRISSCRSLSVEFEPGADGGGRILLVLAGDGAVALEVEALEVVLRDVTRPYAAPSGRVPDHRD